MPVALYIPAAASASISLMPDDAAKTLGNFRNRIAPFRDLTNGITFKIVGEIRFAHNFLLASILGKKVSSNLGAIHSLKKEASRCPGWKNRTDRL